VRKFELLEAFYLFDLEKETSRWFFDAKNKNNLNAFSEKKKP
jgi:hypothetical protein